MDTKSNDNQQRYTETVMALDEEVSQQVATEDVTESTQEVDEQHELFYYVDQAGKLPHLPPRIQFEVGRTSVSDGSTLVERRSFVIPVTTKITSHRSAS